MIKKLFISNLFIGTLILLFSCTEQETLDYKLTVLFNGPIPELKENDPLPELLKTLVNYIDTKDCLYVPMVTFQRNDFNPPHKIEYEVPISGVNKFRKSLEMLSPLNLKEDYNDHINKLKTPKLLVETKDSISETTYELISKENVLTLNINTIKKDSLVKIQEKIKSLLSDKKGYKSITILITYGTKQTSAIEIKKMIQNADNLFHNTKFKEAKDIYIIVLKLDPNNKYVSAQIKKCNEKSSNKTKPKPPKTTSKDVGYLTIPYAYYKGEIKNRQMHGEGTLFFKERHIISPKDPKKRYADSGDYVSGIWFKGNLVNGKLFDKNGEQKETLIIGH